MATMKITLSTLSLLLGKQPASSYLTSCIYNLLLNFILDAVLLCECNYFSFNFNLLDITNGSCSIATWNYHEFGCTPVTYTIQGFNFEDAVSRHFNLPRVEFHSSFPSVIIPTNHFREVPTYFRIIGINVSNEICARSDLLNLMSIMRNG